MKCRTSSNSGRVGSDKAIFNRGNSTMGGGYLTVPICGLGAISTWDRGGGGAGEGGGGG